jgi:hypothetical protein
MPATAVVNAPPLLLLSAVHHGAVSARMTIALANKPATLSHSDRSARCAFIADRPS